MNSNFKIKKLQVFSEKGFTQAVEWGIIKSL